MEDGDTKTNIIAFLILGLSIVGVIFIVKFLGIEFFEGDEIKAYSAECKTRVDVLGICKNPSFPLGATTYKVSYSSQRVIGEIEGSVQKFTDCTVKDRKNWTCSFDDKSGDFGFRFGTFFDVPNWGKVKLFTKDLMEKIYYPSRLEYIDLQAKGCKDFYPICYFFYVILD